MSTTMQGQTQQQQQKGLSKKEDQPMKEETSTQRFQRTEESKEGGMIPSENMWKDFDDWSKTIFSDFNKIDHEIDRRFKDYSDFMNKNRQMQLEDIRKDEKKQIKGAGTSQDLAKRPESETQVGTVSHSSYTKEHRQVETRAL